MNLRFATSLLALSLLGLGTLGGCVIGQDCPAIFIPSLRVSVVDDQGNVVEGVSVSYNYEGEGFESCGITDSENMLTCGGEGSGEFIVVAELLGYEAAEATVTVDADGCNVLTEDLELVLVPASP